MMNIAKKNDRTTVALPDHLVENFSTKYC